MKTLSAADIAVMQIQQRIQLVEDIWDSIAELPEAVEIPEWHRKELEKRLEACHANPDKGSPSLKRFRALFIMALLQQLTECCIDSLIVRKGFGDIRFEQYKIRSLTETYCVFAAYTFTEIVFVLHLWIISHVRNPSVLSHSRVVR